MSLKRTFFIVFLLIGLTMGIIWLFLGEDSFGPTPRAGPASHGTSETITSETPAKAAQKAKPTGEGKRIARKTDREEALDGITDPRVISVYGKVVHGETGSPVAGAVVRLSRNPRGTELKTRSDALGKFHIDGLSVGHYYYHARSEGRISFTKRRDLPSFLVDRETLSVGPLLLRLSAAHELIVTVVSELDSSPVAAASIAVSGQPSEYYRTDGKGLARLYLTPETWDLEVWAEGYERVFRALDVAGRKQTTRTIRLPPGGLIFGRVTDQAGSPIADVRITAHVITGQKDKETRTDSTGYYELGNLSLSGNWSIWLFKTGYRGESSKKSFEEGRSRLEFNLILTKNEVRTLVIWGKVVDGKDQPVQGARLAIGFLDKTLAKTYLFSEPRCR